MTTTNSYIAILLCAMLGNNGYVSPFSNSEMHKIIDKLSNKKIELNYLYGKNINELKDVFFDSKTIGEVELNFLKRVNNLLSREPNVAFALSELEKWGIYIVTIYDEKYPIKIKETLKSKSPILLYYSGNLSLCNERLIGFSGSRLKNIKSFDEKITKEWSNFACKNGFGIVSGGASGIDTFAIQSAIASKGNFVEFLCNSMIERIKIPQISNALSMGHALLLSEVNPYASFNVGNAMSRNKYIYILSEKTIVIKATYKLIKNKKSGGAWNGAIENLKSTYKKLLVYDNPKSEGNKELIKMGAIPIKNISDKKSCECVLSKNNIYLNFDSENSKNKCVQKKPKTLKNAKKEIDDAKKFHQMSLFDYIDK